MKRARHFVLVALAPFVAWCADVSADPAFARYRSIIDRMPFGEPPPNFDPTLAPGSAAAAAAAATAAAAGGMTEEQRTEEEQKLASSVRVSVLNVTPAGRTMVGFTDSSAKPPEHYYLPVGGERDGWSVKSADPATEKITLAKGELEVTLKLGEGSTGNAKDGKEGKDGKQKNSSSRGPLRNFRRSGLMGSSLASGPASGGQTQAAGETSNVAGAMARLRERRVRQLKEKQAEDERRAAAAAEEKAERARRDAADADAAEQAAAEREQQRVEREQQRAALQQIQEELRRQREEKEKLRAQDQEETEE